MKIMFANGRQLYPLFQGGDGISFHCLFEKLQKDGHEILCVGKYDPPQLVNTVKQIRLRLDVFKIKSEVKDSMVIYSINGYKCFMVEDSKFLFILPRIIDSFKPDIILTQLDCSHQVIDIASKFNIKVIHFIHDHDPLNFLPINKSNSISHVIFNSKNTSFHYAKFLKCESSIIYPLIKLNDYTCVRSNPKFITMINPTISKGARIFEEIASKLPDENFLMVKGWKKPEVSNNLPGNVQIVERQYDMRKVYSQTKILLVPSQWEESFGRIIPEAGTNGIPIVASRIGGIPESLGSGGILISQFNNSDAWVSSIKQLLANPLQMERMGANARKHALKFDFPRIYNQLTSVFYGVHHS